MRWLAIPGRRPSNLLKVRSAASEHSGQVRYGNWLRLDKLGDDIFLYLNGMPVFSLKISTSGKPLHRFAGIGIVQGGIISGTSTQINFE